MILHLLFEVIDATDDAWVAGALVLEEHWHYAPLLYRCIDQACPLGSRSPQAECSRRYLVVYENGAVVEDSMQRLYDRLLLDGLLDPFDGKPPPKWRGAHVADLARAWSGYVSMKVVLDTDPFRPLSYAESDAVIQAWVS